MMASHWLTWLVSLLICQDVASLQKTRTGNVINSNFRPTNSWTPHVCSALTNSAPAHQRPLSHAVAAATPRSQRLRLAAAPDAEPDAAATDGGVFGAAALVAGNMVGGGIRFGVGRRGEAEALEAACCGRGSVTGRSLVGRRAVRER